MLKYILYNVILIYSYNYYFLMHILVSPYRSNSRSIIEKYVILVSFAANLTISNCIKNFKNNCAFQNRSREALKVNEVEKDVN